MDMQSFILGMEYGSTGGGGTDPELEALIGPGVQYTFLEYVSVEKPSFGPVEIYEVPYIEVNYRPTTTVGKMRCQIMDGIVDSSYSEGFTLLGSEKYFVTGNSVTVGVNSTETPTRSYSYNQKSTDEFTEIYITETRVYVDDQIIGYPDSNTGSRKNIIIGSGYSKEGNLIEGVHYSYLNYKIGEVALYTMGKMDYYLIPAISSETNKVGFYDIINDVFYPPVQGEWIAGPIKKGGMIWT